MNVKDYIIIQLSNIEGIKENFKIKGKLFCLLQLYILSQFYAQLASGAIIYSMAGSIGPSSFCSCIGLQCESEIVMEKVTFGRIATQERSSVVEARQENINELLQQSLK